MLLFFILAYFNKTSQFLLKHYGKNSYLCESNPALGRLVITECGRNKAIDFKLETSPAGTEFLSPKKQTKILDVDSTSQVILWQKHGGENQQLQLVYIGPDKFAIVNRGKCLTLEDSSLHFMRPCKYSNDQILTLVHTLDEKKELVTSDNPAHIYGDLAQSSFLLLNKLTRMIDVNSALAKNIHNSHINHYTGNPHAHFDDNHYTDHNQHQVTDRYGDYLTHYNNGHHSNHYDDGHHSLHYEHGHHSHRQSHGHYSHHHDDDNNPHPFENDHNSHNDPHHSDHISHHDDHNVQVNSSFHSDPAHSPHHLETGHDFDHGNHHERGYRHSSFGGQGENFIDYLN
ncbi:hypothetical protein NGRA_2591 [Nosema granulosis]|uniref:Ricin B lectin domain-containing protein n=1 Tax=Nosema granulosis TaxID=83296 RepID=A0A9P6KY00_9MICR|nr:hypothetical protein NGRA_2591 [Nosema granulosis]